MPASSASSERGAGAIRWMLPVGAAGDRRRASAMELEIRRISLEQKLKALCREEGRSFAQVMRVAGKLPADAPVFQTSKAYRVALELLRVLAQIRDLEWGQHNEEAHSTGDGAPEREQGEAEEHILSQSEFFTMLMKEGAISQMPDLKPELEEVVERISTEMNQIVLDWLEYHNASCDDAEFELSQDEYDGISDDVKPFIERKLRNADQSEVESDSFQDRLREQVAEQTQELIRERLEGRNRE